MFSEKKAGNYFNNNTIKTSDELDWEKEGCCPDEDTIGSYLDDLLDNRIKAKLDEHLRQCPTCQEKMEILIEIKADMEDEDRLIPFPEEARQKAIALFSLVKPQNVLDIVIKFIKGQWMLMKHTGLTLGLTPAMAITRGKREGQPPIPYFQIQQEFDACTVKATIENIKNDLFNLQVNVNDKEKNLPLKEINIKLIDKIRKRKLEEVICDGQTTFEGIRVGGYKLELIKEKKEIGQICLNISK